MQITITVTGDINMEKWGQRGVETLISGCNPVTDVMSTITDALNGTGFVDGASASVVLPEAKKKKLKKRTPKVAGLVPDAPKTRRRGLPKTEALPISFPAEFGPEESAV